MHVSYKARKEKGRKRENREAARRPEAPGLMESRGSGRDRSPVMLGQPGTVVGSRVGCDRQTCKGCEICSSLVSVAAVSGPHLVGHKRLSKENTHSVVAEIEAKVTKAITPRETKEILGRASGLQPSAISQFLE